MYTISRLQHSFAWIVCIISFWALTPQNDCMPIKCSLCSSDCLNTSRQMMFACSPECLSAYCCFYSVTPYTPSFHRVSPRAAVRGRNHWTTQSLHQPTSRSINQSISLTISCFVSALAEKKLGRSPTIRLSRRVKKQPLSRPVIGTTLLPPLLVGVRGTMPILRRILSD